VCEYVEKERELGGGGGSTYLKGGGLEGHSGTYLSRG